MNKIDISDTLIERPVSFSYKRERYSIYPLSLGKYQLCARLIETLGFDKINSDDELYSLALKTSQKARNEALRLISYVTLQGADCLDETKVRQRLKTFYRIKDKDLASLLVLFLRLDRTEAIMREYSIDKETTRLSDVLKIKSESEDKGSLSFGGKSIWGTMIDSACERYGWTYQYVLWGISFSALQLLLADYIKTVYLTDDERKKARISKDNNYIKAEDTESLKNYIASQNWR